MKTKLLFALLFFFLLSTTKAQTYSFGNYVCDTITSLTMQRTAGNCISYGIDLSLVPYVKGLTLNLKILDIYPCDTCVDYYDNGSFVTQRLLIGDTLKFWDTISAGGSDMFRFNFNSTDTISYQVLAMGTPTILNEPYFCNPNVYSWVIFDGCSGFKLWTLETSKNCNVSTPTNILNMALKSESLIYPNPTNQFATVEFNNPTKQNCTLTLCDLRGQIVRTINNISTDKVEIERQNLASGLYFFQLRTDSQIIATGKLTIE